MTRSVAISPPRPLVRPLFAYHHERRNVIKSYEYEYAFPHASYPVLRVRAPPLSNDLNLEVRLFACSDADCAAAVAPTAKPLDRNVGGAVRMPL